MESADDVWKCIWDDADELIDIPFRSGRACRAGTDGRGDVTPESSIFSIDTTADAVCGMSMYHSDVIGSYVGHNPL